MVSTLPTATAPPALRQHVAYRHDLGGPGPLGREANRKCFVEKLDLDDFDDFVEIDRPNHDAVIEIIKRSEEHTSELQSHLNLVCRLLLEKKKKVNQECGV